MEETYDEALQLLKMMDKNTDALRSRSKKLKEEYGNEYVAIDGGKVIAHSKNYEKLKETLESKKTDLATVLIKFIPELGVAVLY